MTKAGTPIQALSSRSRSGEAFSGNTTSFPSARRLPWEGRSCAPAEIGGEATLGTREDTVCDRDTLYSQFAPLFRRLIRQFGTNPEMQDDLRGELYCRFDTLLEAFDPKRGVPLRPYLVRHLTLAAYTYARQQWRIQRRETAWQSEGNHPQHQPLVDPTLDWLAALDHQEVARLLPSILEDLPMRQRSIVLRRYYEGRSFEEIAERLGILPSSVRSLLRHALNSIRKALRTAGHM